MSGHTSYTEDLTGPTLLAGEHARILRQIRSEANVVEPVDVAVEERDLAVYGQLYEAAS